MSCNCVCKSWQSIICENPYFIDLHFCRSELRNSLDSGGVGGHICLLIEWSRYEWGGGPRLLSAQIQLSEGGGRAIVQREIPILQSPDEGCVTIVDIVNGLFCLADIETRSVCIYNPSTRKSTPWIKSAIKQQWEDEFEEIQETDEDGDPVMVKVYYSCWHAFGYDPATKQHKVVAFWQRTRHTRRGMQFDFVCEVLIIAGREDEANNRRFHEVSLPPKVDPRELSKPLYASGSIYWLFDDLIYNQEPFIVEFNVGSEEFRIFSVPNFILDDILYPSCGQLIEVDGHLAMVGMKKIDMECQKNNNTSMKMCILHVDHDQDRNMQETNRTTYMSRFDRRTSTDSCYYYWMEETFLMPPSSDWEPTYPDAILAIPGTDLFIIRSFENNSFCFYYYNWRKKDFSTKCEIVGMTSFFHDTSQLSPSNCILRSYSESLLPVV